MPFGDLAPTSIPAREPGVHSFGVISTASHSGLSASLDQSLLLVQHYKNFSS